MQNESPAVGPDDSTSDLGADTGNSINLTQEQATNAGIVDPQVGDEYTITIKVGDTSEGVTATILDKSAEKSPEGAEGEGEEDDAEDGDGEQQEEDKPADMAVDAATPVKKKKSRVMSPNDMGISMANGL